MTTSEEMIVHGLTSAVGALVASTFGEGCQLKEGPPERFFRRYSFIFRYWVTGPNGWEQPLFVKIPHPFSMKTLEEAIHSERLRSEIRYEYVVLKRIADMVAEAENPGLTALNPLGVCDEFNAIVMEEIRLSMLKDWLQRPAILMGVERHWHKFERLVSLGAQWAKILHETHAVGKTAVFSTLGLEKLIGEEIDLLEQVTRRKYGGLRTEFQDASARLSNVQIPLSALHHDFHLGNIFVAAGQKVGALDPNWKDEGVTYQDLASLLIDPLTRKWQVVTGGLLFRRALYARFEAAVLAGYFGGNHAPQALNFYCAYYVLLKWRMNGEILREMGLVGRLISGVVSPYFLRLISFYLTREAELYPSSC